MTAERRSFLTKLWMGLGFLALAEFIWLVVAFLKPRKPRVRQGDFGTIMTAGSVEDFPLNSVTAFRRGHFYLVRMDDGGFLALSRKCTHLGCTVPWNEKDRKFICPCHSSAFDIKGDVISSPAPRALDLYQVFIEHKIIKVDTNKQIKRSEFRPDQMTYSKAAS